MDTTARQGACFYETIKLEFQWRVYGWNFVERAGTSIEVTTFRRNNAWTWSKGAANSPSGCTRDDVAWYSLSLSVIGFSAASRYCAAVAKVMVTLASGAHWISVSLASATAASPIAVDFAEFAIHLPIKISRLIIIC